MIRDRSQKIEVTPVETRSRLSSFGSGLSITLGDKAVFFYLSFFPAFINLNQVSLLDVIIVMAIATVAVGGVKVGYAYLANRATFLSRSLSMRQVSDFSRSVNAYGLHLSRDKSYYATPLI